MEPLLTSAEVAELLHISTATLSRWRVAGTGPRWLDLSGIPRYAPNDVRLWLDGQERE